MNIYTKLSLIGCLLGIATALILGNLLAAIWAAIAAAAVFYINMLELR
jgi:hypothetical protein